MFILSNYYHLQVSYNLEIITKNFYRKFHVYVCVYVCVYVWVYVCMYVSVTYYFFRFLYRRKNISFFLITFDIRFFEKRQHRRHAFQTLQSYILVCIFLAGFFESIINYFRDKNGLEIIFLKTIYTILNIANYTKNYCICI